MVFATEPAAELDAYADVGAERIAVPDGAAKGAVSAAVTQSTLPEYPKDLVVGTAHVPALAECFAYYVTAIRADLGHATDAEDARSC